jgi:hypothetical protein
MVENVRDRFLIALSQMLGEQPPSVGQQAAFFICEPWALEEILKEIIPDVAELRLNRELFNRLMLSAGQSIVTPHFFNYFFKNVKTIEDFEAAVKRYRIKAMWLYGNFRFALKRLAFSSKVEFEKRIAKTEPIPETTYTEREPFEDIEPIARNDLDLLGYLTGSNLENAYETLVALRDAADLAEVRKRIPRDNQERIMKVVRQYGIEARPEFEALTKAGISTLAEKLGEVKKDVEKRQVAARIVGKRNTHRYLSLPELDVYVATSMRETEDFVSQSEFIQKVFSDPQVADLKLRYFDPTLSFADDRISKGLIEMLMLKRAKVTIYSAGKEETLGKDSELASTLAQGKAVIAYVPDERRFKTFRDNHPLGLQIDVNTGVAHGIIVVRSPEQCAKMLRRVMLRTRTFDIRHENNNYQLVEQETGSVVRVVSDDPYLTHAFWTYFNHRDADPS